MEIVTPGRASYPQLEALQLARLPRTERRAARSLFAVEQTWDYRNFRAAHVDGELAGWGFTARPTIFPGDWAILAVYVAARHEGAGIGTALRGELQTTLPESAATLAALVDDAETQSLEVARHWGYEVHQHAIHSRLDLVDLPEPDLPEGVTVEDASALDFPDEEAVGEMLADSQTNPEAAMGIRSDLRNARLELQECTQPFAMLARVHGEPAAIITGEIQEGVLLIFYTGVGRRSRGRNLGFLLKQAAHLEAAARGATSSYTTNEEQNGGIRHVNARLGYRVVSGDYRVSRTR